MEFQITYNVYDTVDNKQASKLTEQIFYLPVVDKDIWKITRFYKGKEETLTQEQFESFVRTSP